MLRNPFTVLGHRFQLFLSCGLLLCFGHFPGQFPMPFGPDDDGITNRDDRFQIRTFFHIVHGTQRVERRQLPESPFFDPFEPLLQDLLVIVDPLQ